MGKCLLLRDREPNDRYEALLSHLTPHSIPVIQNTVLCTILPCLEQYQGLIVTSKHAVEFIRRSNVDLTGKRLAVVGPQTSLLLDEIGLKSDYVSNNAAELCEVILDECEGLRWLYLKGNLSLDIISSSFKNSDHRVDELVVYVTEKNELCGERIADYVSNSVGKAGGEIIVKSAVHWVVFFSPSGVLYSKDAILDHFPSTVKLVAFGPSTAKEVGRWFEGYEVLVCKSPTPQGVLGCVLSGSD